jgi:hypothetical protein
MSRNYDLGAAKEEDEGHFDGTCTVKTQNLGPLEK